MTAHDPAVEAVRRVVPEAFGTRGELDSPNSVRGVLAVAAAREALKPIRELHQRVPDGRYPKCSTCEYDWPCATAYLIYPDEELEP